MQFRVPTLDLEKCEKDRLQSLMVKSFPILTEAAKRNGKSNCKLRNDYRAGDKQDLSKIEIAVLDDLFKEEQAILGGWIRVATDICFSFSIAYGKSLQLDVDDLVSEAYLKVYDAMYQYDGTTEFSTYVYWVVKRKMIDIVRKTKRQIVREAAVSIESFDHLYGPDCFSEDGNKEESKQEMLEAIAMTPLTDKQRVILEEYMRCDFNQAEVTRSLKSVSRQAVNQTILLVVKKIRETLHERSAA